jgi:hypothetical protein
MPQAQKVPSPTLSAPLRTTAPGQQGDGLHLHFIFPLQGWPGSRGRCRMSCVDSCSLDRGKPWGPPWPLETLFSCSKDCRE